jgi:folate-binding protein YgfZ
MSDALPNPLREIHEQADAEFQPYADLEIVSTFGEPQLEYAAVRKGCGLIDLPQRGVLEVTGKDRLPFLNNLLTNQTWDKNAKTGLASGQGVFSFFLNGKGRIVADMNVLEVEGGRTLLEMDARMIPTIRAAFDKYLFVEQVKMTSRVGELHEIALLGPKSREILSEFAGGVLNDLPPLGSALMKMFDVDVVLYRDDPTGTPGYFLIIPATAARVIWMNLISNFGEARRTLRPIGWAAFNATRVEAGRPLFDIDFGNSGDPELSVLPAETGPATFARAVSVTKGCYLGQEIVARMYARQQVAKQLVGLRMEEAHLPVAGAPIFDEKQNQVGVVTSSTVSPVLSNAAICLGYVKRPLFAEGTILHIPAEGSVRKAAVVSTPFVQSQQ